MWRVLSVASLVLIGCASPASEAPSGPADLRPAPTAGSAVRDRYREGRVTNIQPDVDRVSNDIPAPPDGVWKALVQVYGDLGIEIAGADPRTRSLNNPDFAVSRRLGGERLSRYMSCGSGIAGGFADNFRIQMNILSQVETSSDGQSILHTTIQAYGINPEGVSNTRVPCSSTHQLEYRIAAAVEELVGG